jgi:hypothetical protein
MEIGSFLVRMGRGREHLVVVFRGGGVANQFSEIVKMRKVP